MISRRQRLNALDDARGFVREAQDALRCAGLAALAQAFEPVIALCDAEERDIREAADDGSPTAPMPRTQHAPLA